MWQFIFYVFLAYLLYQFVFRLVLPIYRTTRQVRKGFRDMQERMNQHQQPRQTQPGGPSATPGKNKNPKGDYIDFEEVKD
jgi:hypothetical protein